jgi:hypothetical protein
MLGLFFDPEDGGELFLRNGGCLPTNYTISQKIKLLITTVMTTSNTTNKL